MRFKFIEEHRTTFSINLMCRVMAASRRQRSDLVTLAHIKEQSRLSLGSYALHGRVLRSNVPRVAGRV